MARAYPPISDLAKLLIDERGLESIRELATLLDLEGDEQRRVYKWMTPSSRGSFAGTLALLEAAEMLNERGLAFLRGDASARPDVKPDARPGTSSPVRLEDIDRKLDRLLSLEHDVRAVRAAVEELAR